MFVSKNIATRVIAHRGAWRKSGLPQNSVAALRQAMAIGCEGSECDVQLSADNVLVVAHDADWGGLSIATSDYARLSEHRLANGEVLPRFTDFLHEITATDGDGIRLIVELKDSALGAERTLEAVGLLLGEVAAAGAQARVEYIVFSYEAAQLLVATDPQAHVSYLGGDVGPEQLKADGLSGFDYELALVQKHADWFALAAELGLASNVWTVNAVPAMRQLLALGAGSVTTDEPELLQALLKAPAPQPPLDPGLVVFAYSDVGYACLKLILERGVTVRAVFTHEDSPQEEQWFGSVSALAEAYGVPVYRPEKITRAEHQELIFGQLGARLLLSFYYRNLLPTWLWSGMELGAFNMHGSYLPSYRGRAPLNWAIINGEDHTGVTLHFMVKEADAGDIVDQEKVMISETETAISVRERSCGAAVRVMERQLDNLLAGTPPRHTQDESLISYFGKRTPEDGRIDWGKPAGAVFNLVRALTRPYPGAFTEATDLSGTDKLAATAAGKSLASGRLLVWWGEVRGDLSGRPGEVLSAQPLTIACGQGAFEITDSEPVG